MGKLQPGERVRYLVKCGIAYSDGGTGIVASREQAYAFKYEQYARDEAKEMSALTGAEWRVVKLVRKKAKNNGSK